jgi:hypothetical protein
MNHTSLGYQNNSSGDPTNRIQPESYQPRLETGSVSHDHVAVADGTWGTNDQLSTAVSFEYAFSDSPYVVALPEGGSDVVASIKNLNGMGFDLVTRNYLAADIGSRTIHWAAFGR